MAPQQAKSVTEVIQEYSFDGEPDLDEWRKQVEQARRESVNAYSGYVDSLFYYYRDGATR